MVITRNEEKCIGKALSALRKQSVPSGQIIVVDDGSRDRTILVASEYADVVVGLPDRGYGVVGRPELARLLMRVEAIMLSLRRGGCVGEAINVGTGKATTINRLARVLVEFFEEAGVEPVYAVSRKGGHQG